MKRALIFTTLFSFSVLFTSANEGMWLPMFVKRLNYTDMQKYGLKLTSEEIYSINNSSLKDAIVMLNNGSCTSEMISKDGLLLTNHHCAYGGIQQNSSVNHDYLEDGFWAKNKNEELKINGMSASFLVYMEDVSEIILSKIDKDATEEERMKVAKTIGDSIVKAKTKETSYNGKVKSFFSGNEFYLFVYETFNDVRLVGAPPSSVGKFGGDTDNWEWPRHTGDFSLLRIYTDEEGKSAEYRKENIPLKAKYYLPIFISGVSKNDFAMIMGFPGSTNRYLPSFGVKNEVEIHQPSIVKIRTKKLEILKKDMNADKEVKIKYASKYAGISNYWKYFIGQSEQLNKNKVYERKVQEEKKFTDWVNSSTQNNEKYGEALPLLKEGHEQLAKNLKISTYLIESGLVGSEICYFAFKIGRSLPMLTKEEEKQKLLKKIDAHFKNYNMSTDKKVTAALFKLFSEEIDESQLPKELIKIGKKYKNNFNKFSEQLFKKSVFASKEKIIKIINSGKINLLQKDMAFVLAMDFFQTYKALKNPEIEQKILKGNRLYIDGLRKMQKDKKFYSNANSTMRLTYGTVQDYFPRDAVYYNYYTTYEGIIEKRDNTNPDFIVPQKLVDLFEAKDFGDYADKKTGKLHICFLTDNDITGGNSGSPVINGKGQLIGCAFDGNWEAMSGDISFEKMKQRTIAVDIRYVLFIIDKYAGASNIINELTLMK